MSDTELVLQEWEDDGCGEYGGIECGNDAIDELDSMGGWSVTDMFQANKDKCVGNGTVFDESEFSKLVFSIFNSLFLPIFGGSVKH